MADTITESVVWTLCPNGRDKSGNLHFSVFVAPRLIASAGRTTLATPTVWQNWPELLKRCKFSVVVPGVGDAPRPVERTSGWSSDVYASLFPASTPVVSYNTAMLDSLKSGLILSYPVKTLADHIEKVYAAIAASGEDMPKVGALQEAGWPGYRNPEERRRDSIKQPQTHQQRINAYRSALKHGLAQDMKGVFEAFSLFHTPLLAETTMVQQHQHRHEMLTKPTKPTLAVSKALKHIDPKVFSEDATWPGFVHPKLPMPDDLSEITDFHKIAAALSNYNQLARLCGFVIDFTMTKDVADGLHPKTPLALHVLRDNHPDPADTFASTICVVSPSDFAAFDPAHDYDNGFVRISNSGLDLVQLDVDGAAHKAAALGSSLERMTVTNFSDDEGDQPRQDDMRTGTPSLRSAGLMVAKTGRSDDVSKRAQRNAALHGSLAPELNFGDILRGYRADIMDNSEDPPRWRSLHRRTIAYTFRNPVAGAEALKWHTEGGKTTGGSPEEEGVISTSVGSSPDGSVPDVYTLHEGVFVWRGWSLSAPEPFRTMRHRPDPSKTPDDHASMIGDNDAEVPDGMPLQTRFFVRPDPDGNLPRLRFGHSYSVRLRTVDMCGNSLPLSAKSTPGVETEPVRYRRYEPVESPVITLIGKVDPGDATANWKNTEAPLQGESMMRMALRTRNAVYDGGVAPETASVHRGIWPPRVTQRFAEQHGVLDDDKGKLRPDLYGMLVDTDDAFAEALVPSSDALRGPVAISDPYKGQTTRYAVSHGDLPIPYLPDPLAIRAKVRLLLPDGNNWSETEISFHDPSLTIDAAAKKRWDKDGPPVRGIVIEGRESIPGHESEALWYDKAMRVLYVRMPRGRRQRLRISFMVPPPRLATMALWDLMDKGKASDEIKGKILAGRHWMFTPWREIEMVHAVQKPLTMPVFTVLTPSRAFGASDVDLTWVSPVDGHSTVRIDLNATWNEPDDNDASVDAKTHPVHRPHSAQISQQSIARHQDSLSKGVRHHFHDTRARLVTYRMDAISRFKEFFEKPLRDSENDMKITSAKSDEWIKSSARPPAPVVLYAIPTFGWFTEDGLIKASRRTGGIRVWLDRPWLATGYNEMLAVILPEEKSGVDTTDTADNLPFVTQWGRDPIWLSSDIATNSPARKNFPLAKLKGPIHAPGANVPAGEGAVGDFPTTGLQVPKQPGTFAIAPHQVGYDADRELWYADIVVDIPKGSYFPFVRLAVARYQPMSLEWDAKDGPAPNGDINLHLSSPVTCDFMQISADRIAVLVPTKGNAYRVVVFGDTPTDDGREVKTRAQPNVIRVRTQVLDAKGDPVAGWRDVEGKPKTVPGSIFPDKADNSVQVARTVAIGLAKRDIAEPLGARGGPTAVAVSDGVPIANFAPNILFDGIIFLPDAPSNGRRRVLITESEVYPRPALNHEEDPGTAERIVYAEGLEV